MRILKAGIHSGEEALVQGNERAGMVVFSGCHLSCRFCYTPETSRTFQGTDYTPEAFSEILVRLLALGARNINLISPTHVWNEIEPVLRAFKEGPGKEIPLILKFSGFEPARLIQRFAEVADVLVPDFKVASPEVARTEGLPASYGEVAARALAEMLRTHAATAMEGGRMRRGIIVRHLLMPGYSDDSARVLELLHAAGYRGYLNLMTCFLCPTRGLVRAAGESVRALAQTSIDFGMQPMVDAQRWVA